jgi:hypothetical protein
MDFLSLNGKTKIFYKIHVERTEEIYDNVAVERYPIEYIPKKNTEYFLEPIKRPLLKKPF